MADADIGPHGTGDEERWSFRLYVQGREPRSIRAFVNLKRICEEHLRGRYHIEVVDLSAMPDRARDHDISSVPAVVRIAPAPGQTVPGDLADVDGVRATLGIPAVEASR